MPLTRQDAEDVLNRESRLLDERRFEEWLELFTADGIYWLPMVDGSDPRREPSLLYDDARLREQRVHRLLHEPNYAQLPPSRTIHYVSNIDVEDAGAAGDARVRCNLLVVELRPGPRRQLGLGKQNTFAARCEYHLRAADGWKIALKKVLLIDSDQPVPPLTFLI